MTGLELTSFITAIANAISSGVSDDDVLSLLGAIFTQLGDTLTTISITRSICNQNKNSSDRTTITTKYS